MSYGASFIQTIFSNGTPNLLFSNSFSKRSKKTLRFSTCEPAKLTIGHRRCKLIPEVWNRYLHQCFQIGQGNFLPPRRVFFPC